MKLVVFIARTALRVIGFFKGSKYKYSQVYEDNFRYMDTGEKIWWAYKSYVRQIERAEKGQGIEEYFRNQNLCFTPDKDFKAETKVILSAGGDLNASKIITPESTKHLWDDIEDFYFQADIISANLETPIDTSKPCSGVPSTTTTAPKLNTTPEMFEVFRRNGKGVNLFATANNHSLDMGEEGLLSTLDNLDNRGCIHSGTSRTQEEQDNFPVIERNGIRIAFLSYTYCLNGNVPISGKEYMTNVVRLNKPDADLALIKRHIAIAHEKKADVIVAMLHWSIEFESYPIKNVIDMGHKVMDLGVDIILGGHAHVVQPMEKYTFYDKYKKVNKNGFIIYSFGDLVAYNRFRKNSRLGLLLKLEISKGVRAGIPECQITGLEIFPIYSRVTKLSKDTYDYRLLNFKKLMKQLDNGTNDHGFSVKQIKELRRIEMLLKTHLLPTNFNL